MASVVATQEARANWSPPAMNHAPSFRAGKARIAVIPFAPAHRGGRSHCGASALRAHEPMPDEVLLDHLATPPSPRLPVDQVDRKSVVSGKSVSVRVNPGGRRSIK